MIRTISILVIVFLATTAQALAWGRTAHRLVNDAAIATLPSSVPAFVRAARTTIRELGPELDRSKSSGVPHDADLDPGHFIDLLDDGTISGVSVDRLPLTREDFDTALRAGGSDEYKAGYLPYSIIDGWQQVIKDFAMWRVDVIGTTREDSAADRAWFRADQKLWEMLTIRDIGVWGHYVGDASQPLHVSVHAKTSQGAQVMQAVYWLRGVRSVSGVTPRFSRPEPEVRRPQ